MLRRYLIWVLILIVGSIYSIFSVVRHLRLETYIFDLGYYDQLLWLAAHGKPIFSSILEAPIWVDHFQPSIFLLTPLYFIWEDVRMLLIFQSFFVCLGAYPIYLLSLKKTKSFIFSIILSFCYMIFYGLQNAVAFDFHAVTLGPTLLTFIFYFYEEKRFKLFWLLLLIFVGLQENFFILASAFGLFLAFQHRDYKRGVPIFLGGTAIFILLIFFIIPKIFGTGYYYVPKQVNYLDIPNLFRMLYQPASKIDVVFFALASFAFLPLLSPFFLIMLGEEFLGRFLGTTNSNWWILGFHYNAILAPVLAVAAIFSVRKYFSEKYVFVSVLIVAGSVISLLRVKPDIKKVFDPSYYDYSFTKKDREVLHLIPKDASVAATNNLGAQLSERENIIFLTNCVDNPAVWGPDSKRCFKLKPEYLVADLGAQENSNNYYPDFSKERILKYFRYLEEKGEYRLIKKTGDIYLYKKNYSKSLNEIFSMFLDLQNSEMPLSLKHDASFSL